LGAHQLRVVDGIDRIVQVAPYRGEQLLLRRDVGFRSGRMRVLQHPELLRVIASANRQLHRVGAGWLEDRERAAAAAESTLALADPVGADADLRRIQRTRAIAHTLRW